MSDKRYFIGPQDAGLEAYTNAYVHGLEAQIESLRAVCKEDGMSDNPCCRSCGTEWTNHDGAETLCRKYGELVDLIIAAHIGEVMARARLKDFAEKEIEARQ